MPVSKEQSPILSSYVIDSVPLTKASEYKQLGIILSSSLGWTVHVDPIVPKALRWLGVRKGKMCRISVTELTVHPLLEYADFLWDSFTHGQADCLESLQKKASHFVHNLYLGLLVV